MCVTLRRPSGQRVWQWRARLRRLRDNTHLHAVLITYQEHDSSRATRCCPSRLACNVSALQAEGTTWRGTIQSVNKGGVVLDVNGLRGFVPLSRLSPDRLQALDRQENQTGQPIAAKIIQVSAQAISCTAQQALLACMRALHGMHITKSS